LIRSEKLMKHAPVLALLLLAGAATPSQGAAPRDIGQAILAPESDHYSQRLRVEAPVESLTLRATGGAADCLSVRGLFRDDTRKVFFHGIIPEGGDVTLPLTDSDTSIRQLFVRCSGPDGTIVQVSADPGRFVGEWNGIPFFNPWVTSAYNWGSNLFHRWQLVGLTRFRSHFVQTEIAAAEPARATSLALMPVGVDARCRSATARYADGKSEKLDIDRNDFLARNRYYKIALDGDDATLEGVELTCRATDGNSVVMRVFSGA
jgi:hypothetical protein